MKISFLIPRLTYSGAPKMLAWVANQMALRNHDVEIVAFFSDEVSQKLEKSVKFYYLEVQQSRKRIIRNTVGMLQTLRKLNKHIKKSNPDIIVSFLDSVGYMYLLINKLGKKRKIIVSERVDPYQYKGKLAKIRFQLMKWASGYVFQTEGARKFFNSTIKRDGAVIPNPAKVNFSTEIGGRLYQERDNRIVSVGRLNLTQKRQDVLIEAFEKVYQKHSELSLHIYGEGEDREKIQNIINAKGLQECVFLEGRTNCVEEEIVSARVFVLTSDFEGIPNALIEAMALGVPAISTDCSPGGAALLINDEENGFLVPVGDFEGIAEKMRILIENEEISNKFTISSTEILEKFSEEKIADLWEKYFLLIFGGKNGEDREANMA